MIVVGVSMLCVWSLLASCRASNAMFPCTFFSASQELIDFASPRFQRRSERTSQILGQLFLNLRREGFTVSYTVEDFQREFPKTFFAAMTPEERRLAMEGLAPEERRQILEGMSPEDRQQALLALPPEQRQKFVEVLSPEERLEGLSKEQIQQYLERLGTDRPAKSGKTRKKK